MQGEMILETAGPSIIMKIQVVLSDMARMLLQVQGPGTELMKIQEKGEQ